MTAKQAIKIQSAMQQSHMRDGTSARPSVIGPTIWLLAESKRTIGSWLTIFWREKILFPRTGIDPWGSFRRLTSVDSTLAGSCKVSAGLIEHENRGDEAVFMGDQNIALTEYKYVG